MMFPDVCALTDEELASLIRSFGWWDWLYLRELCKRAGMLEEWEESDGETFESVIQEAACKLGVCID